MKRLLPLLFCAAASAHEPPTVAVLQAAAAQPPTGSFESQRESAGRAFYGGLRPAVAAEGVAPRSIGRLAPAPAAERRSAREETPAPPLSESEIRNLKITRAAGITAAAGGLGLFGYAAIAATASPIGWAAALVFFGGMAAYLAHRRLSGKEDFKN